LSPSEAPSQGTGPELASVRATTRITILVVCGLVVLYGVVQASPGLGAATPLGIALVALSAAAMTIAIAWSHTTLGPWLAVIAVAAMVLGSAWGTTDDAVRLQSSVTLYLISYVGILLLPPAGGLAWTIGAATLWVAITAQVSLPVTIGGITVNARWLTLVQLLVSALWLWAAWRGEIRRLRDRDELARRAEANTLGSIAAQERMRVWRQSLVRTHETVLNDIRYVLDSPTINRPRLAEQLALRSDAGPPRPTGLALAAVVDEIRRSEGLVGRLQLQGGESLTLGEAQAPPLLAALTEAVRNVVRHTRAERIVVEATADRGSVVIRVMHDDLVAVDGAARSAGIGTGIVIVEGLESIGGRADLVDGAVVLTLPLEGPGPPAAHAAEDAGGSPSPGTEAGRLVMASVAAGNAVGGAPFFVIAAATGGTRGLVAALAAITATAIGARAALRRSPPPPAALMLAAALATAAPLLVLSESSACPVTELGAIVGVLTSFAFAACVVWSASPRQWLLAVGPAAAVFVLLVRFASVCPERASGALGAALLLPVCVGLILASLRLSARRVSRLQRLRRAEAREAATAAAEADLSAQLGSAVERAQQLMAAVAAGAEVDEGLRLDLRCLDSEIRAALQVDLASTGTITRLAYDLVRAAAAASIPTRVLTLRDSGAAEPIAEALRSELITLVRAPTPSPPVIQVLTNRMHDTLVITTTVSAVERTALADEPGVPATGVVVDVEYAEPSDIAVVIVQRGPTSDQATELISAAPT